MTYLRKRLFSSPSFSAGWWMVYMEDCPNFLLVWSRHVHDVHDARILVYDPAAFAAGIARGQWYFAHNMY